MKQKGWEEEFDRVMAKWQVDNGLVVEGGFASLKSFIASELQKQKEEIVEMIKESIKQYQGLYDEAPVVNEALNDILKKLEEK